MVNLVLRVRLSGAARPRSPRRNPPERCRSDRRAEGQHRKSGEKNERAHHVELRRFRRGGCRPARCWDGKRCADTSGSKLAHHVLAEFLGARVGIVVGAVPVDRSDPPDHFMAAVPGDGHGGDLAEAAQAVGILRAARQLRHFQRAAQIHVQAAFLRFAIERRGAMNHRIGGAHQARIFGGIQTETRIGEIAAKNGDARFQRVLRIAGNRDATAARARAARSLPVRFSRAPADSADRRGAPAGWRRCARRCSRSNRSGRWPWIRLGSLCLDCSCSRLFSADVPSIVRRAERKSAARPRFRSRRPSISGYTQRRSAGMWMLIQ